MHWQHPIKFLFKCINMLYKNYSKVCCHPFYHYAIYGSVNVAYKERVLTGSSSNIMDVWFMHVSLWVQYSN